MVQKKTTIKRPFSFEKSHPVLSNVEEISKNKWHQKNNVFKMPSKACFFLISGALGGPSGVTFKTFSILFLIEKERDSILNDSTVMLLHFLESGRPGKQQM